MGHEVRIGEKISTQINIHDVTQLEKEYTETHGDITNEFGSSCSLDPYDDCMYTQLTNKMVAETKDNCVVPWFPQNHSICTKLQDINHTYNIAYERITNVMKDCNEPCHSLVANIGGKNYATNDTWDYGIILFYFSATSFQSKENYLYPMRSLVAEFGGYLGLILGYSCLDFTFNLIDVVLTRRWKKSISDVNKE